jgi:hypothetical protein
MRADGVAARRASAQKSGVASMRRTSREHKHNRSISRRQTTPMIERALSRCALCSAVRYPPLPAQAG